MGSKIVTLKQDDKLNAHDLTKKVELTGDQLQVLNQNISNAKTLTFKMYYVQQAHKYGFIC